MIPKKLFYHNNGVTEKRTTKEDVEFMQTSDHAAELAKVNARLEVAVEALNGVIYRCNTYEDRNTCENALAKLRSME